MPGVQLVGWNVLDWEDRGEDGRHRVSPSSMQEDNTSWRIALIHNGIMVAIDASSGISHVCPFLKYAA